MSATTTAAPATPDAARGDRAATRILGLVPARGGSKGIPRKNIKRLAGKPLIGWTIESALRSTRLAAVVVSTDDEEIAAVARAYGAATPFMRPAELARDDTPGVDPVLHALAALPEFDAVVLLQPTSPLRMEEDIDGCVAQAERMAAPCVISVCEPRHHPGWMYRLDAHGLIAPLLDQPPVLRRQDLPPVYAANGAVYFARADWLGKTRSFTAAGTAAYVMPAERSIDLDTPLDWRIAEILMDPTLRSRAVAA
ncbi:MAG: acylneuraminate cytidylyltransferase family protein [Burkholderiales bacterium]|nr:acylneuraminate cytidylyltransferase family protein [Burkholderiales bacterium]